MALFKSQKEKVADLFNIWRRAVTKARIVNKHAFLSTWSRSHLSSFILPFASLGAQISSAPQALEERNSSAFG